MPKKLTIVLFSGYQENEDAIFTVMLAEAALGKGYHVNLFLFGNACQMSKKEKPVPNLHITEKLLQHINTGKIGGRLEHLARMGARIATCHTTEYGRGVEAEEYRDGIEWGDVGQTLVNFLLTSDVLITMGH